MKTAEDIFEFWFEAAGPSRWYKKSDAFDSEIRREFETTSISLAGAMIHKTPHKWESDTEGALALIVALDQFSRNMYRGTKAAFAWDSLALGAAKRLVASNHDLDIAQERRAFVYMPFMHSESLDDQSRCVELCDQRLQDASTLHHAIEHKKLIERFGRFPHRNEILGRSSSAKEIQFLKGGGYAP